MPDKFTLRVVKCGNGAQRGCGINILEHVQSLTGQVPNQSVLITPAFSGGWTKVPSSIQDAVLQHLCVFLIRNVILDKVYFFVPGIKF